MTTVKNILVIGFILTGLSVQAQDDAPWWKKLFKQETVEEHEKDNKQDETVAEPAVNPEIPTASETKKDTANSPARLNQPGVILVKEPAGFDRLDSLFMASPPKRQGFRLQIYFGHLQSAREVRGEFLSVHKELACYLVQNPPNFAVQIGDFRNQLEAYRLLEELKSQYPGAIVVPAEIENPSPKKTS